MQVFKFGGASVKDANGVKNLAKVLQKVGHKKTLIVVSAMGKTTNALELVINNYFNNKKELQSSLQEVKKYHNAILLDLFENEQHPIFKTLSNLFDELNSFLKSNKSPDYNFVYDQVIGFGELVSTRIISAYLNDIGFQNNWLDVREFIKTDNYYRRIEADRQRELLDEVIKRRKIVAESDLKQYNTSKIREDFNEKFDEFQNNYLAEEMRRQQALENLK